MNVLVDKTIIDKKEIGDILNEQFSSVGESLPSDVCVDYIKYLSEPTLDSFQVFDIDENKVFNVINGFKNNSSYDDVFNFFLLKSNIDSIISPLTFLINRFLNEGKFPSSLKITKIIPLFKKGSKLQAENYRPISLLFHLF